MKRVISRLFAIDPVSKDEVRELPQLAVQMIPVGNGWTWNQALIEFGALFCTSRQPDCNRCPLLAWCEVGRQFMTDGSFPVRKSNRSGTMFRGSSRYYRGRILAALTEANRNGRSVTLSHLAVQIADDVDHAKPLPEVLDLVRGMQRDGLLAVAEKQSAYDLGRCGEIFVALPD